MYELDIFDYLLLSLFLTISILIGFYQAVKDRKKTIVSKNEVETLKIDQYLTASGRMSSIPIAISLLASIFSATTLLGLPAEVYQYGIEHWNLALGTMITPIVAAYVTGPMFVRLKCLSVFEYLRKRYNSNTVRLTGTSFYVIRTIILTSIFIYGPSATVTTFTNISESLAVIIIGSVATFYTTIGGIKAVIWTDVFQMIIMLIGLSSVCIKGVFDVGGLQKLWEINSDGGRLNFFDFNPNPLVRQSFWSIVFGMFIYFLNPYCFDQQMLQRFCAAKGQKQARTAMLLNVPLVFILISLCSFSGLVLYANYANCDPLSAPHLTNVKNPNQLIVYLVIDKMKNIKGFTGLFLSSILSGSLSSVSSTLNSMAAIIWQDFLKQLSIFKNLDDDKSTITLKIIVILIGVFSTGLAILVAQIGGNLIQISGSLNGALNSPLIGVFILSGLFPFSNIYGAIFGMLSGFLMGIWLSYGAFIVKPVYPKLIVNANCYLNMTVQSMNSSFVNANRNFRLGKEAINLKGFNKFYSLSFTWFTTAGVLVTIIVGVLISLLTSKVQKKTTNEFVLSIKNQKVNEFNKENIYPINF